MTDNQNFLAGLILGAVAGATIALFIKSDKGKEVLSDVKEGADNLQHGIKDKLKNFDTAVESMMEKGKSFIDEFEQKADTSAS